MASASSLEPRENDTVCETGQALWDEIDRAVRGSRAVSLRIRGHLKLGALPPRGNAPSMLPWIDSGAHISLWAHEADGAILDAEGVGRHLLVRETGSLRLQRITLQGGRIAEQQSGGAIYIQNGLLDARHVRLTNNSVGGNDGGCMMVNGDDSKVYIAGSYFDHCTVRRNEGVARGGALGVASGDVSVVGTLFSGCSVESITGSAYGGAVAAWTAGNISLVDTRIVGASASSKDATAFGGAIGLAGGLVSVEDCEVADAWAASEDTEAWGGLIGMDGGTVTIKRTTVTAGAVTSKVLDVWGGCVGLNAGVCEVQDAVIAGCNATGGRIGDG